MRVAFLTHEPFFPPSGGGSAEAIYLVKELVARGHEVHLFSPGMPEAGVIAAEFRVRLHQFTAFQMGRYTALRNFKYLLYPSFLQRMVMAAHRKTRFDMVLSQHAIAAVAAGRLRLKLGLPVVMNFLDYLTGFMETWPRYLAPAPALAVLKKFELSMPRRYGVEGIMTVSDTLADYFAGSGYPREKIFPIYYGYDSSLFSFKQSAPRTLSKPATVVMHGSLDHHHLGQIALEAVKIVSREMPGTIFKFVGQKTGPLDQFIRDATQHSPSSRIEATGFVPYAEVAAHLQTADLGIVPYEESTGTHCAFVAKIVEYLGVGLPVASTRLNSASRYFAGEPRITFTDFQGASFAQGILDRLRDLSKDEVNLARAASDRVRNELDWRVIARKAVEFVEETWRAGRD